MKSEVVDWKDKDCMITYRLVKSDDILPVKELLDQIDPLFPIPLSQKVNLDILLLKLFENGFVYVAFDSERAVGMNGFYANDNEKHHAYCSVIGVLSSYQGQGIAKRLLMDGCAICKEKGMTTCVLYTHKTNVGAIAMYEKLGFIAEEDSSRPHDIRFVKKL